MLYTHILQCQSHRHTQPLMALLPLFTVPRLQEIQIQVLMLTKKILLPTKPSAKLPERNFKIKIIYVSICQIFWNFKVIIFTCKIASKLKIIDIGLWKLYKIRELYMYICVFTFSSQIIMKLPKYNLSTFLYAKKAHNFQCHTSNDERQSRSSLMGLTRTQFLLRTALTKSNEIGTHLIVHSDCNIQCTQGFILLSASNSKDISGTYQDFP